MQSIKNQKNVCLYMFRMYPYWEINCTEKKLTTREKS